MQTTQATTAETWERATVEGATAGVQVEAEGPCIRTRRSAGSR